MPEGSKEKQSRKERGRGVTWWNAAAAGAA